MVTGFPAGAVNFCGGIVESVTVGKKLKTPATVGVPEIWPLVVLNVNPVGKLFAGRLHEYGGTPTDACTDVEYGVPTVALANTVEDIVSGVAGLIVTVNCSDVTESGTKALSVNVTAKLYVPGVVGVPTMIPVLRFTLSPGGRQPVPPPGQAAVNTYGVTPNSATTCWL